jgi:16S rRNA (guanine966-N2)-methyltransferase
MRIIAGELKGREIALPRNSRIRPATGFIREMAMNLFSPERIEDRLFLDICAGSGLVGFEALSRGAARAYMIEADGRTAAALRENAQRFGVADRCVVLLHDARRCFTPLRKMLGEQRFGAVFIDPPFIPGMAADIVGRVGDGADLFEPDALIIARSPDQLPDAPDGLRLLERRGTGNGAMWLYEPAAGGE